MNRTLIGAATLLAGIAVLAALMLIGEGRLAAPDRLLGMTIGIVLLTFGAITLATAFSHRSVTTAVIRLDLFLPFLKKQKKNAAPRISALLIRVSRRVLPKSLLADPVTGKPGLLRRAIKRLGPSWYSSPVRRVIQTVCFLVFLWLFFYVCWPYSAQPARSWSDWAPVRVDGETGRCVLASETPKISVAVGATLHVTDESIEQSEKKYVGEFRVVDAAGKQLTLDAAAALSPEQIGALSFSSGPWTLHESNPGWPSHYADDLAAKEFLPAESILVIDPLVSLSTALAARAWVWSLSCAGVILVVGFLIPRGFCGYICPLGTLIDLFDWSIGKRVTRFRAPDDGWWVHIKYYLLMGTLVASMCGVLVSGYVAAIPVITRGLLFVAEPIQTAALRGRHLVAPINAGHVISIVLFFVVLGLGLFKPRFWCKYVCPSGAVFSIGNLFRATERKVESTCINCNKCVEICPFDAIKPDFTTRTTDCTLCQTCGGVCPTHAIKFVERWNVVELKVENDPPTHETALGRRGFLSLAAGTAAAVVGGAGVAGATKAFGANLNDPNAFRPIRPPGSVPEQEFLELCIRCGECFKTCPYHVLQAVGFEQGLEGLWTPQVKADTAGCESSCNACTQVCPTGAIRELPLYEKRHARMGLAIVNDGTCLPIAGREACQLCVDECIAAGYEAIEFTQVHTEVDELGLPIEGTGFLAPNVVAEKCVGCGLCQTICFSQNVKEKHLLGESAIIVEAGEGKEDRLMRGVTPFPRNVETGFAGSYAQLRRDEQRAKEEKQQKESDSNGGSYLPDFLLDGES